MKIGYRFSREDDGPDPEPSTSRPPCAALTTRPSCVGVGGRLGALAMCRSPPRAMAEENGPSDQEGYRDPDDLDDATQGAERHR